MLVIFLIFPRALLKNKRGVSIFSDLECPSGVRHINSADSAEIRGLVFAAVSNRVYARCRSGAENDFSNSSSGFLKIADFRKICLVWGLSHYISA